MKRTISILTLLLVSLSICAYDFVVNNIAYNIIGNSELEVTKNDTKYSGDITIPEKVEYNGKVYHVTAIGSSAFSSFSSFGSLTSVTIPNSVTSIGDNAFERCNGLISVTSLNTEPPTSSRLFGNSSSVNYSVYYSVLYVPKGCVEIYRQHNEWGKFVEIKEIGSSSNNQEYISSIIGSWKLVKEESEGGDDIFYELSYLHFETDGTLKMINNGHEFNPYYDIKYRWNVLECCLSITGAAEISGVYYESTVIYLYNLYESNKLTITYHGSTAYLVRVAEQQGSDTSKSRLLTIYYNDGKDAKYKMGDVESISMSPKQTAGEDASAVKLEYSGTSMTLSLGHNPQIINEGDNLILKTSSMSVTLSVPCTATFIGVSDTNVDRVILRNDDENLPINVFTIDGKKVATVRGKGEALSLERGVYIINGKKVVIK